MKKKKKSKKQGNVGGRKEKKKQWKPERIRSYGVFERADEHLFPAPKRKNN